ncbi:glutamate dehydrogenase 2-like [Schistocerca gregaria]|uniref:glutamate dehydrogenase 2-like n=1 Tax=Schistocerca gregaria TaxID=7010 RepID=UPI00211EF05F|nr:glutamate dehydrogenase 2-like [Schistocerca gregaria]
MTEESFDITTARLLSAAASGNLEKLKSAILGNNCSHVRDYDSRTPLHLSASNGYLDCVKLLVETDPTMINSKDRWNHTPLMDALDAGHELVVEYLCSKGATTCYSSYELAQKLSAAASEGSLFLVKFFLKFGADVNSVDYNGKSALHFAVSSRHTSIVRLLLEHGADVNISDRWGLTPISEAAQYNYTELVEMMQAYSDLSVRLDNFKNSECFISALYQIIKFLFEKEKWNYTSGWHVQENFAVTSEAWLASTSDVCRLSCWRQAAENAKLPIDNSSIIGRVIQTGKSEQISHPNPDSDGTLDPDLLLSTGFKSTLVIPISIDDKILGALEFRSFSHLSLSAESIRNKESIVSRMITNYQRQFNSTSGCQKFVFADQVNEVFRLVLEAGFFTKSVVRREVEWYYTGLGLHEFYWRQFSPQKISQHIMAFIAAKLQGQTTGTSEVVRYRVEETHSALYIYPLEEAVDVERRIETRWLAEGYQGSKLGPSHDKYGVSVKQFLSEGYSTPESKQKVIIYLVSADPYVCTDDNVRPSSDIWKISTGSFLLEKVYQSRRRYERCIKECLKNTGFVISVDPSVTHKTGSGRSIVITICYMLGSTHSFLSSMTLLLQRYNLCPVRKYIETFANGLIAYSFHLDNVSDAQVRDITDVACLNWILPRTSLSPMVELRLVDLPVIQWAYCGWKFAYHFLSRVPEEWLSLYEAYKDNTNTRVQLLQLKKRMRNDLITEARVSETIMQNPDLIQSMYEDFKESFCPREDGSKGTRPQFNGTLWNRINKASLSPVDMEILRALLNFNCHILKTNFYKKNKVALSFRLDPIFLAGCDYSIIPYGVFLVIGAEFRGFHIRFDDVARGGIRLIMSRNKQIWQRNAEGLFDENYNLALTQTLKNKDIPESGSKGTVFLNVDHQDKAEIAFRKYFDSILDLILPSSDVIDYFGQPEILFFGPDEGTAGFMDWAALHARKRGYKFWSSITTGKSPSLGGIPHDLYGMTTSSVHEFVLGIISKLGLKEEQLRKVQTGGPDGDLGSNEIKISKDKTIAIVDGSGVLYDPNGIDRSELLRLAKNRLMVSHFNQQLLGPGGFLVLVDDADVRLPDGTVVENGMNFRNNFHLEPLASADLFVPCGGRPASVNLSNVDRLISGPNNKPLFKYAVEGANLFFTQEARIKLESVGVILFKDSSANKGGVTSSSAEVLASLCMNDEEYSRLMCVKDDVVSDFYKEYVVDIQNRIKANARAEFECLWTESTKPGAPPLCILSDGISERINQLNYQIRDSELWNNQKLVKQVFSEVIPQTLQREFTLDKIFSRLPKSYVDATLSSYLAASYVYTHGLSNNEFAFYQFMQKYFVSPN